MGEKHQFGKVSAALPHRLAGGARRMAGEQGQAFLELAMVLPLICILIFGIAEFGVVLGDQQTLNHAAADGARIAARGDSAANGSAASSQVTSYLSDLHHCPAPNVSVTYNHGIPDYVTVNVSCAYSPFTPLGSLASLAGSTINTAPTLSATTTMRVQ
jgi:Flp pilus assembly protein TadG